MYNVYINIFAGDNNTGIFNGLGIKYALQFSVHERVYQFIAYTSNII